MVKITFRKRLQSGELFFLALILIEANLYNCDPICAHPFCLLNNPLEKYSEFQVANVVAQKYKH